MSDWADRVLAEIELDELVALTRALQSYRSFSGEEQEAAEFHAKWLSDNGFETQLQEVANVRTIGDTYEKGLKKLISHQSVATLGGKLSSVLMQFAAVPQYVAVIPKGARKSFLNPLKSAKLMGYNKRMLEHSPMVRSHYKDTPSKVLGEDTHSSDIRRVAGQRGAADPVGKIGSAAMAGLTIADQIVTAGIDQTISRSWTTPDGAQVLIPDQAAIRTLVTDLFAPPPTTAAAQ